MSFYKWTDAALGDWIGMNAALRSLGKKLNTALGNGTFSYPLILNTSYLWVDAAGKLRIKATAPTTDTDGTVVGTQT